MDEETKPKGAEDERDARRKAALAALAEVVSAELAGEDSARFRRAAGLCQMADAAARLYARRVEDFDPDGQGVEDLIGDGMYGLNAQLPALRRHPRVLGQLGQGAPLHENDFLREVVGVIERVAAPFLAKGRGGVRRSRLVELREAREAAQVLDDVDAVARLDAEIRKVVAEVIAPAAETCATPERGEVHVNSGRDRDLNDLNDLALVRPLVLR